MSERDSKKSKLEKTWMASGTIPGESFQIVVISILSLVFMGLTSWYFLNLRDAQSCVLGAFFSAMNLYFYIVVFWDIFSKKNIASLGVLIVIKYSLLLVFIFLIWGHVSLVWFALGLTTELIITALLWLLVKQIRRR